jgi:uncharacterized protein YaiE (UPF0345 family)
LDEENNGFLILVSLLGIAEKPGTLVVGVLVTQQLDTASANPAIMSVVGNMGVTLGGKESMNFEFYMDSEEFIIHIRTLPVGKTLDYDWV